MEYAKNSTLIYTKSNDLTYEAIADDNLYLFLKCSDILWHVPHYHDSLEIVCSLHGEVKVHIDEKIYRLQPHQMCFIDAHQIHFYENYYPNAQTLVLVLSSEYTHHFRMQYPKKTFPTFMEDVVKNKPIVEFLTAFAAQKKHTYLSVCGYTNLLFDLMLNTYPMSDSMATSQVHVARDFIDYIRENYKKDISLKGMAKDFGYTPEHFSKLFNKAVGMNFLALLNGYRMQKVMEQLNAPNNKKSVIQLSYECGFNSPATFYRHYSAYKKKMVDLPIPQYS